MSSSSGSAPDRPADRITLAGIRARCILGVHPWERRKKRPVEITLSVEADLEAAAQADALELTVDYSRLTRLVRDCVEAADFRLLEALARHVAGVVLAVPGVSAVEVTVSKPGAIRRAGAPRVTMRRERT